MNILKPKDVLEHKSASELEVAKTIPQWVYDIFNDMIAENFESRTNLSKIYLHKVKERVRAVDPSVPIAWFDVEPVYRENGWIVDFHKGPYYQENTAYYIFSEK